jgi:hypothetical protein
MSERVDADPVFYLASCLNLSSPQCCYYVSKAELTGLF